MKVLENSITFETLRVLARDSFGDFVKVVVDVGRELIAIDAELHSDLEALLLGGGSQQTHLWGVNLYPDVGDEEFIEFDSMINLRPIDGNMSRGVDCEDIKKRIVNVIKRWVCQ